MELRFSITEEEYLELLELLLKKRRKSPVGIITLLLMTVVQLGFALWSVVTGYISGGLAWAVLAMSVLIAMSQILYQLCIPRRARHRLDKDKAAGRISADFWSRQFLKLKDDALELRCGKSRLSYDCAYFVKAEELGRMLLLEMKKDNTAHQLLIPLSAFSGEEEKQRFLEQLQSSRESSIRAGYAKNKGQRPEAPECSVTFHYDRKSFQNDTIRCARRAYLTRAAWNLSTVAKIAGTAFLLYHVFAGSFASTAFTVFALLVCFLLCYPFIITFTPLIRLIAVKNGRSLFGGLEEMDCAVDLTEDTLYYSGDTFFNAIRLTAVRAVEKSNKWVFVYLRDGTSVTVPITEENANAASRLYLRLDSIAEQNRRR